MVHADRVAPPYQSREIAHVVGVIAMAETDTGRIQTLGLENIRLLLPHAIGCISVSRDRNACLLTGAGGGTQCLFEERSDSCVVGCHLDDARFDGSSFNAPLDLQ